MRRTALLLATVLAVVASRPMAAQKPADKLPPVSYVCPMGGDEDVIEDKPGTCRKCGMELEGIRLDSVWTCLNNTSIVKDQPGTCPTDGRPLVQMTMALSFVCMGPQGIAKESINPGMCPDGTPMQRHYAPRAHGNHNPQHGGGFFMAPDNWHHLEGAFFAPGTFRLYLYDDFTKPLTLAQVRTTQARLIVDGKNVPLVRNGRFLEAKLGKQTFPLAVQTKVKFQPEAPEHHFDFTFEKYSVDAPVPATTTTMTMAPPAAPGRGEGAPGTGNTPPLLEIAPSPVDAALVPMAIPETVPEMLAQLKTRNDQIKMFIERGAFANVYVPAFQAKDVALALDAKKNQLPPEKQRMVSPAVSKLVRSAYLLDAFGDLGNKQQITEAYARFAAAVKDLEAAFPK